MKDSIKLKLHENVYIYLLPCRIYASIRHIKSEFAPLSNELGQLYGPYRSSKQMSEFIEKFYDDAGVSPCAVEYVEAFGTG